MQAVKGISMEKWLCWVSMGIAGLLLLLFLLDLFLNSNRRPCDQLVRLLVEQQHRARVAVEHFSHAHQQNK